MRLFIFSIILLSTACSGGGSGGSGGDTAPQTVSQWQGKGDLLGVADRVYRSTNYHFDVTTSNISPTSVGASHTEVLVTNKDTGEIYYQTDWAVPPLAGNGSHTQNISLAPSVFPATDTVIEIIVNVNITGSVDETNLNANQGRWALLIPFPSA